MATILPPQTNFQRAVVELLYNNGAMSAKAIAQTLWPDFKQYRNRGQFSGRVQFLNHVPHANQSAVAMASQLSKMVNKSMITKLHMTGRVLYAVTTTRPKQLSLF